MTLRNRRGKVVATLRKPFCPGIFSLERGSNAGPVVPGYPDGCSSESPFVRGTVWGLHDGWASNALSSLGEESGVASVRLRPARYMATVRIAPPYDTLLGVAPGTGEAGLMTVKAAPNGPPGKDEGKGGMDMPRPVVRQQHALAGSVPDMTDPDPSTLPDLIPLPAWNVRLSHARGRELLTFASSPWNAVPSPPSSRPSAAGGRRSWTA